MLDISTARILHEIIDFYTEVRKRCNGTNYGWSAELPFDQYVLKVTYTNMLDITKDTQCPLTLEISTRN